MIAAAVADAVEFSCTFSFAEFSVSGRVYICKATVRLTGNATLENVSGSHPWGNINDDVEGLWINAETLTFVPQGIEKFFRNLRVFRYDSSIRSINVEYLKPFGQLETLILSGNNLISLDLFANNPFLKYLSVSNNRLQHIGYDLVTNLNYLQYLNLQNNFCINRYVDSRAAVIELAPQLSELCPPVDETTTEPPIEQCPCGEEIEELRKENQQQNKTIADVENRLQEVEKKLLEILPLL